MAKRIQHRMALVVVGVCLAAPAFAATDPLVEGARLCTQQFPVQEKAQSIPTHLLAAIATTESGRYHEGLGMNVPWPWTINVEGKGYYFDTKAEAVAQVIRLQAKGVESIDVGCMQVNLKHHPKAFANLDQAFDPATNVHYAAKFLRENYADLGDWIKATAAYHSRTAHHGARYLGEIERSWNRIVAKVAAARSGKTGGGEAKVAMKNPVAQASLPKVVGSNRTMQPAQRARVIQVRDEMRRTGGDAIVVRAQPSAPVMAVKVADASPAVEALPPTSSVRRVSLDNSAGPAFTPAQASGPKFVFAN